MVSCSIPENILDFVDFAVFSIDGGAVRSYNPQAQAALQELGIAIGDGFRYAWLQHPIMRPHRQSMLRRLVAAGRWSGEVQADAQRQAWLKVTVTCSRTDRGRPAAVVCTISDITTEKIKLEQHEKVGRYFQKLMEEMPFMMTRSNKEGNFTFVNRAYSQFVGQPQADIVGRPFFTFVDEEHRSNVEQQLVNLKDNSCIAVLENHLRSSRGNRWTYWMNMVIRNIHNQPELLSIGIDIHRQKEMEEKLQRTLQAANIVNLLTESIFVVDRTLAIPFVNDTAKQWFDRNEMYQVVGGSRCYSIANHSAATEYREYFEKNQEKIPNKYMVGEDNRVYERHSFPVMSEGVVDSILIMIRQLSNLRGVKIDNFKDGFLAHSFVDNLKVGIIHVNKENLVVYANHSAARLFGYTVNEMVGMLAPNLVGETHHDTIQANFEELIAGYKDGYVLENLLRQKDGTQFWGEMQVVAQRSEDGSFIAASVAIVDISKHKKNVEQLQEEASSLKGMLTSKDRLFSVIGHDLKHPLNTTQLFAEQLLAYANELNDEFLKKNLGYIRRVTDNGLSLLSNLLVWSKSQVDGVNPNTERVNLYELVLKVNRLYAQHATWKGVSMVNTVGRQLVVNADRNMLETILRNLCANALKYSHRDSTVEVTAFAYGRYTCILVKDSGVGIACDILPYLFEPNPEKIREGTDNEVGAGFGLQISQRFVLALGGRIWLESKVGEGTSVFFTIPNA